MISAMFRLYHLIVLFFIPDIHFALASQQEFVVSPSLYFFDYAEYDTANNFLDGETGIIPGIHFAYHYHHKSFSIQAQYSEYGGNIDYDGQTQSGIPHQTTTDTFLRFYNITLYSDELEQSGRLFFRLASSYWDRDILSSGGVAGLHEIYRWQEISLGLRLEQQTPLNLWAEFSILKTHNATMDVLLPAENIELNLGEKPGLRLEVGQFFKLEQQLELGLSGFYEYWQFGRSEPVYVADFFGSPTYILEPDSESRHWGLRVNLRYRY